MVTQTNSLQSTTQKYLEIFDITNDLLMLQDGSCSLVLKTSAINFDLFSEEEQDATIYAYAALLNSLSFPIEIVVRSQKKDVSAYLDLLKNQEVHAYTPMQKNQIRDYRLFVEQLVQERNVLDKKFYVVLTASAIEMGLVSATPTIPLPSAKKETTFDKYAVLDKAITILQPRADHLMHQFARIGLSCEPIKTQDLIQLFYTIYNPGTSKGQKITDASDYTTPLVQANLRTAPPTGKEIQKTPPVQQSPVPEIKSEGVQLAPTPTSAPQPVPQPPPSPSVQPVVETPAVQPQQTPNEPIEPAALSAQQLDEMMESVKETPVTQPATPTPIQTETSLLQPTPPPVSTPVAITPPNDQPQQSIKEEQFTIKTDLPQPSQPPVTQAQ